MKAIVLHEYGPASNLMYEDFPDPTPAASEVLVSISATSINPADWIVRAGMVKDIIPITFPYISGSDLAGTVVAVGENVTSFEPGDLVMGLARQTHAELCVVPASTLIKIPDGLDMTTAAALPLVNLTGDQLIRRAANVQKGQTVLITGALGGVGRSAVFAATEIGAHVIAGVRGRRLEAARQLPGVREAIAIDDGAEIDKLPALDCVADTVGGEIADQLLPKVKAGGTYACFPKREPRNAALYPTVHVNVLFGRLDQLDVAAILRHYAEAVRDGKLTIPIECVMPLADAAEAQTIAEKGGTAKIILLA